MRRLAASSISWGLLEDESINFAIIRNFYLKISVRVQRKGYLTAVGLTAYKTTSVKILSDQESERNWNPKNGALMRET